MVEENKIIKVISKLDEKTTTFFFANAFRYCEDEHYYLFLPYVLKNSNLGERTYELVGLNEPLPTSVREYLKKLINE